MPHPLMVFVSGITGVFCGMALLYLSIKSTAAILDKFEKTGEEKK